jgi:hypothetical protein
MLAEEMVLPLARGMFKGYPMAAMLLLILNHGWFEYAGKSLLIVLAAALFTWVAVAGYRRKMGRQLRHDLMEKTGIQTIFGKDPGFDPYDDSETKLFK